MNKLLIAALLLGSAAYPLIAMESQSRHLEMPETSYSIRTSHMPDFGTLQDPVEK